MRGLNSRAFVSQWQALYAASNPGLLKDRWEVGGVAWTRERHAFWGGAYSFQFEIHRMEHWSGSNSSWVLLVVVERWWGPDRDKSIREAYWCRSVAGKTDRVLAWMRKQTVDS